MDESSTSTYHSLARMDIPSISNADLKFMVQLTEDDDELGKIAQEDVTETIWCGLDLTLLSDVAVFF